MNLTIPPPVRSKGLSLYETSGEIVTWQDGCWYATREGNEDDDRAPRGQGNTPEDAKQDLIDVERERYVL